tara:strand:+ start:726 stop:953 length:228 start_codon:yes stop_codon:yes gene_type:complete
MRKIYQNTGYRTTSKNILYRYPRLTNNKKQSGGNSGVSGVSKELLSNNTNTFRPFLWCIYGVSMVYPGYTSLAGT